MKIEYDRNFKEIVLDGEENYFIARNGFSCFHVDGDNIQQFYKDTGVRLHIKSFIYKGFKELTFKDKIKIIIAIIKA